MRAARTHDQAAKSTVRRFKALRAGDRWNLTAVSAAAALTCALYGASASANPTGGTVISGHATIVSVPGVVTVDQTSQNATLTWQTFNLSTGETVRFVQPNARSVTVNRILGSDASTIFGKISANGQIFLINPNGILFGKTAQLDVGGLVASTLSVGSTGGAGGHYELDGSPASTATVTNEGRISAPGGNVVLVGAGVSNLGTINAPRGSISLVAGSKVDLDVMGNGLLTIAVDQGALAAQVSNSGTLSADGGSVLLSSRSSDALLRSSVNNTGVIEARTLDGQSGSIRLLGDMQSGTATVAGRLDASAPDGGSGGFVETSAAHVTVADSATVTTSAPLGKSGTWLIDPHDYTVASSGGDISGAALSSSLGLGNVSILSSSGANAAGAGNININDVVSWSANNRLTLTASNNVNVNAAISATGTTASIVIAPRTANGGDAANVSGMFKIGPGGSINLPNVSSASTTALMIDGSVYTVINSLGSAGSTTKGDLQGMSGDITGHYALGSNIDASATSAWNSGAGFTPIGSAAGTAFTGVFEGLGHTVSSLTINRPSVSNVGLFGYTTGATVQNVGLLNATIHGSGLVGTLEGFNGGVVKNSYATGTVNGAASDVGGLVGHNNGAIAQSYANVAVTNTLDNAGGLVGYADTGSVITDTYATGSVYVGRYNAGGLVGNNGTVTSSVATSYATGTVGGHQTFGGLIGANTGHGPVSSSYWNKTSSGITYSAGGIGLTTAQMMQPGNFAGFDFSNVWVSYAGQSNPLLREFLTPLVVTPVSVSRTYDRTAYSGNAGVTYSTTPGANLFGSVAYAGTSQGAINAGTYTLTASGLYSNQQGYLISYASGSLTVNQRPLAVSATGSSKVYDGTTSATVAFSDNRIAGDVFIVSDTSATFSDKNVGMGKSISVGGISITGTDAANYTSNTSTTTTASITPRALVVSATGSGKVYDGTTGATVVLSDNRIAGDSLTESDTSASFADKNVGSGKTIAVGGISITGTDAANYTSNTTATTSASITPRALVVSASGAGKVYDGSTSATVVLSDNRVAGDSLTESDTSASFADKNVGSGKTIAVGGISLSGADAANYTSNTTATTSASITPRALIVSASGAGKVYDGSTSATVVLSDNRIAGDSLTESDTSASFADKNVGTGKSISVGGISITGTDAANYTSNTTATTSASITPRALVVSASGAGKVYDGSTSATVALSDNRVAGDSLTESDTSASFADKNVGTNKSISVGGISLTGADAANYTSNTSTTTTASITPRALVVSATGAGKVYDGSTAATVVLSDNRVAGDSLTESGTSASFADKNVGTGKSISVGGISITGTDAANYTSNTSTTTTASITPRALVVSATGAGKVYDGSTAATVVLSDNRVAGDSLTESDTSASFADKNVGTNKSISVGGISLTGADAANYTSNTSTTTTASITPRALVVSATGAGKVYDGSTAATVVLSDNRVAGDSLTESGTSASFADKNVGTGKSISVGGISITGTDAANYTSNTSTTTTASITPRALVVSATGAGKVYDGSTAATVVLSDNRVAGDSLTESDTSASFADKNVGTNKSISVGGISLTGADAANYTSNTSTTTTASITPRALVVSATGAGKVYDGSTAATVVLSDNRVAGDSLTESGTSASFADKNVGTGKSISVGGISITGTDAANYTSNTSTTTTASITPRALVVSATGSGKVYDGTTGATVVLSDNRIAGDSLTESDTSASFADKNVGSGKTIAVGGISITGTDAANYTSNTSTTTTASITPRALVVSATGAGKVYDGSTAATVVLSDNRVAGDSLTESDTSASFADKNVGTNKSISVGGISLTGADAANYTSNTTATTSASITPRALVVSASGAGKVYDGSTSATVVLSDNRVAGDSLTESDTSASFADKNVGSGKTIAVGGISLSGADAANYTSNTTATTSASITPRALVVSASGAGKVYDGSTSATVVLSDNRIAGDSLTESDTSASFADKNVGSGKTIAVGGISLSGADAANYTSNTSTTTTASITPRALVVSATGSGKVYDGTTGATVVLSDNRIAGDSLTESDTSASFADKNVGSGKTIAVGGISITGTDAANYTSNTSTTTTASITPRALVVSATGAGKVYDGSTAATVVLSDNRVAGDSLTESGTSASFADKNVGTGKSISVGGISITGTDAANYTSNTTATTSASITPRALVVSASGAGKVYDGSTSATVVLSDNRVAGDSLTESDTSASFADKNVGTNKSISVGGISLTGADAANYTSNTSTTTTASITPRALVVSAIGQNRIYDGTSVASLTFIDNRIAGDSLTATASSASFSDKNVGIGKPIAVGGIGIAGLDAGNYVANTSAVASANVTPASLLVTAGNASIFGGTPVPVLNATFQGFVGGDSLSSLTGSLSFALPTYVNGKVGTFEIVPGGLTSPNYLISYANGSLRVGADPFLPPPPSEFSLQSPSNAGPAPVGQPTNARTTTLQAGNTIQSDATPVQSNSLLYTCPVGEHRVERCTPVEGTARSAR